MKTQIVRVLQRLQDPYLVSSFQNRFGVYSRIDLTSNSDRNVCENNIGNGTQRRSKSKGVSQLAVGHSNEVSQCGHVIKSSFWYYVFSFGTSLGYELFYATFFPFWTWNLDSAICRKVINVWVIVMYIGQAFKDIIRWPRPSCPPVVHMEPKYVVEYGMPSTHAMVAVVLPFSCVYFAIQRYEYPVFIGIFIAVVWCVLVCCSRLYMGMHTVLDIIGGLIFAVVLMCAILPISEAIDLFQQRNTYSPVITLIVMMFLQMIYPKTTHWTPARGDTSIIMGTGTGFAFGTWLNYKLGIVHPFYPSIRYHLTFPSLNMVVMSFLRTVVGLLCMLTARQICKTGLYFILCCIMREDYRDPSSRRKPCVEIPSKFLTYLVVGVVIMYLAPRVFFMFGIERKSMYIEI